MTWRELMQPIYVLGFLEGFLMAAIPGGGLAHAAQNGVDALGSMPNAISLLTAGGLGLMNGIRRIQALATPPPGGKP